jgi:subtilase family serine protease
VVNLGTEAVLPVGAGLTVAKNRVVTLPGNLPVGRYFFGTQADAGDVVAESDESEASNVGYSTTSIVVGPDLVLTAATAPATIAAGGNLSVTYTLKNQGGAASGTFAVGFTLVPVNAGGTPILPDVSLGSSSPLSSIPAGGRVTLGQRLTIPSDASGLHRIRVIVDPGNGVLEADEDNNVLLTTGNLNVALADLVMQTVTATPAAVAPTGNISVTQVIRNLTPAPGGAAATTSRLYLSPAPSPITALTSPVIGDVVVPAIAGSGTATVTRSLPLPPGTVPGTYWIYARTNAVNPVPEAGLPEQVNNLQRTLTPIVVGPDLTLTTLTVPAAASPNLTIPVTSTVKNLGGQRINGSVVRFFLSPTGVLDGSQIPIGVTSTATLAPGASLTTASRVTIPGNTPPGGRFLLAQADSLGIAEANATNNVMFKSLNILPPNLQVTSITTPAAVIRGRVTGAPNVSVVVKNAGAVPSAPFDVSVFANRDDHPGAQTPGSGDLLFTRTVAALLPNATTTVTAPIVIPEGTAPSVRLAGNYGTAPALDFTGAIAGQQTGLPGCTFTGTVTVVR